MSDSEHEHSHEGATRKKRLEASPLALLPVELIEKILLYCGTLDLVYCRLVCSQWHDIIHRSAELGRMLFLEADPCMTSLLATDAGEWQIQQNHSARQPKAPNPDFSYMYIANPPDKFVCSLHPLLLVKSSGAGSYKTADFGFTIDNMDYDMLELCSGAYVSQPPCYMSEIYLLEFSARRRYLSPDDKRLATLGMLIAAVEKYRDSLIVDPRVPNSSPASPVPSMMLDWSRKLYLDGYVHCEAAPVLMAKGSLLSEPRQDTSSEEHEEPSTTLCR